MPKKDEIEIDFSKITRFFKNLFKEKKSKRQINPVMLTTVLILIPLLLAFFIRLTPAYLPLTEDWAENSVYGNIRNTLTSDINNQHPHLDTQRKQEILNDAFTQFVAQNKQQIEGSIKQTSEYFKSALKNENGHTYLLAIDPYTYYRQAENILERGHQGDAIKDGTPWNDHKIAPLGEPMYFNLHPYVIAYFHRFMQIFGAKDLMGTAFFVPILISALSIIPAFFLGRRFAGNIGGFIGATIIAVSSSFISRTAGGFVDTDAYNVFFPLLIAWLFIEAMERKSQKSKLIFSGLAGLSVGVFSAIWQWWYIFDLIVVVILGFFVFNMIKALREGFKQKVKNNIYSSALFIVASGVFVTLFTSIQEFISGFIARPLSYYNLKAVATTTLWPNVLTTVAEQNALSVPSVINQMGGPILFYLSILGIFLILFDLKKLAKGDSYMLFTGATWILIISLIVQPSNPMVFNAMIALPFIVRYFQSLFTNANINIEFSLLSLFWFAFTFFAAVRGVRFTLLLVPIFALGIGVAAGKLLVLLESFFKGTIKLGEPVAKLLICVAVIALLVSPISNGFRTATREIPSMNDGWYEALSKIKQESQPDAIINSWWDFGHWFKAIGDRAVTFDGASQNTPMAHWIGLSLLTHNEKLAVGILRMLDCGSNRAFEVINEELNDTPATIDLLYEIVVEDKATAKRILAEIGVSDKVLEYSHCEPPEDYYITSADMVGKSGVWAHFGSWDFKKAEMYRAVKKLDKDDGIQLLKQKYAKSDDDAMRIYYEIRNIEANNWIAPWPSYVGDAVTCSQNEGIIICDHPVGGNQGLRFEIDTATQEVTIPTQQGAIHPVSFTYPVEDGFKEKLYDDPGVDLSLNLIPVGDGSYRSLLLQPKLSQSTFTKLFFYKGHGTECFDLFDTRSQITGGSIIVWKVNWDCLK